MIADFASDVLDITASTVTRAPALTKGLRGMPCSYSSCTRELNFVPDGSFPQRVQISSPMRFIASISVNSFEMLWIENGSSASPILNTSPAVVHKHIPNLRGDTRCN